MDCARGAFCLIYQDSTLTYPVQIAPVTAIL